MISSLIKKLFFILSFLFIGVETAYAQVYPVQVNTQLLPPYTPLLSAYTAPGAQRLVVQLRNNDVNIEDHLIKLRITIEGVGITIRTKATFVPQPITLQGGGIPTLFYGEDIAEYFNADNLDFAGYSKREYQNTGKIPEGVYRFSVEVLDYNRSILLSNKGTTVVWMILNDPPLLSLPRNDTRIEILNPVNIPFSWTPRHTGSPNAAFSTEYIFRLVEIWPANRNPYDAFLSQQPLYEVTTSQSQIVYGPAEPALIAGRKYAWQVQAIDTDGRDLFKNSGRSEVRVFQFGDELGVPENFRKELANTATISLRWESPTEGEMPSQYRIRYKTVNTGRWQETVTNQSWSTLSSLRPDTEYEFQVRAERDNRFGEYTIIQRFSTTQLQPNTEFSCGRPPEIIQPTSTELLLSLAPGDIFTCNDFSVVVTEIASGANGRYIGKGMMQVKMLNGASIAVTFAGTLNNKYELTAGGVQSIYEQGSPMGQVIEKMNTIGEEKVEEQKPKEEELDLTKVTTYIIASQVDSVMVGTDGTIEVISEDGTVTEYEQKKDETTGKPVPTVIQDASGDQWLVKKDEATGETKVTKLENGALPSGANTNPTVAQADPIKDRIIVLILEQFEEEIAAWLRVNGKGGEDDGDVMLAAELPDCFDRDAGQLKYLKEQTIAYYKAHPAEFRAKVEENPQSKTVLDRISRLFSNSKDVDWNKVSEEDRSSARNSLCLALKGVIAPLVEYFAEAMPFVSSEDFLSALEQIKAVYEFLKDCDAQGWESMDGGIIPKCFWEKQEVSTMLYYSNADLPFLSGLIDGAYSEGESLVSLPDLIKDISEMPSKLVYAYTKAYLDCGTGTILDNVDKLEYLAYQMETIEREGGIGNWFKGLYNEYQQGEIIELFTDCGEARDIRAAISDLYELKINWREVLTVAVAACERLDVYFTTLASTTNEGRYSQGRLVVPATATILPFGLGIASKAGRLKDLLKVLKEAPLEQWSRFARRLAGIAPKTRNAARLNSQLTKIYDDLVKAGYNAIDDGQAIVFRGNGNEVIAKIADDVLQIKIPDNHGAWAKQAFSADAVEALKQVNGGAPMYRMGTLNKSLAGEAQYWSLENPMDIKDIRTFANKYGIPEENLKSGQFFVEIARPWPGVPRVARGAPAFGNNPGGSIEIVVPTNGAKLESFHTIKFD